MHQSAEFAIKPPTDGGGMQVAGRHSPLTWLTATVCLLNVRAAPLIISNGSGMTAHGKLS
jgi:hypothetical protein